MMVTHAYLEIQRRDALEQVTEEEAHFTLVTCNDSINAWLDDRPSLLSLL